MHYSISTKFSITLFSFLSSPALNNRIENLTLITKFRGALRQCFFCLQVAPALVQYILIIRYLSVSCIFCTVILLITTSIFTLILTLIYYGLPCLFDSIIKLLEIFQIFQIFPGPETFFKYFLKHLKHLNISNI